MSEFFEVKNNKRYNKRYSEPLFILSSKITKLVTTRLSLAIQRTDKRNGYIKKDKIVLGVELEAKPVVRTD